MAKRMLYYSQIHSNLTYCLGIWGTMAQRSQIDKLEKIQRKQLTDSPNEKHKGCNVRLQNSVIS